MNNNAYTNASGPLFGGLTPMVKKLILITVSVFLLQIFLRVEQWFSMDSELVLKGQLWRLLTYGFCHDKFDLLHILFNMLMLVWFGQELERRLGSLEFVLFYLASILAGGVTYLFLDLVFATSDPMLGASAATLAILMLYAVWNPWQSIRVWGLFPIRVVYLIGLLVLFDLHPVLLMFAGHNVGSGVAHAAHLGGFAFGFVYGRRGWALASLWNRLPSSTSKAKDTKPTRQQRKAAESESRVDEILDKVSKQGLQSLTDRERKILSDASSRRKKS